MYRDLFMGGLEGGPSRTVLEGNEIGINFGNIFTDFFKIVFRTDNVFAL